MKIKHTHNDKYAQMGMAAMLPGMQFLIERMQAELDGMREQLATMQNGDDLLQQPQHMSLRAAAILNQRVKKNKKLSARASGYWSKLTPEERSVEMRRRMEVALKKKRASHPRDPNHPGHAKWVAKLSKVQKQAWANRTTAEKERLMKARRVAAKRRDNARKTLKNLEAAETVVTQ